MENKVYYLFATIIALMILNCGNNAKTQSEPMKTVAKVDLERYMGTWYEIARFPQWFEKGLVGVTANYSIKKNGNVEVVNKGFKESLSGKMKLAKGFAKIPDPNIPGRLKVYFFWPLGGEYLILDLDENYQHVLVGSSSKKYLWILCRTPKMDDTTYKNLVKKADILGFDTRKLEIVPQQ